MAKSKSDFEKDFNRLEEISDTLESDKITLEDAIKLYEEGVDITKKLMEILSKAELKISQLKTELDGTIKKSKLEIDEES
ncbi:MAG: exodeoxyribonuclease VII small subunit [Ignavibacteria bacterium]|nr:exodeoxyribonuclease VII small subunit [Ignavibacteria bacterium]